MKKILIDTNIIIDYTKGFGKNLIELFRLKEKKQLELFVNPVVLAEFYADKNLLKPKEIELINKLFQTFSIIDISKDIGLLTGTLLRTGQVVFIGDALIAATCLQHNLLLSTNNKKDFMKVKELNFYG